MELKDICKEVEIALHMKQGSINENSTSSDIEDWDSLGHITLMMHLDKKFNDITKNKPEFMTAVSIKDLYEAGLKDI